MFGGFYLGVAKGNPTLQNPTKNGAGKANIVKGANQKPWPAPQKMMAGQGGYASITCFKVKTTKIYVNSRVQKNGTGKA